MKKLLFILFLLPVLCFGQTVVPVFPQFSRKIPIDSLLKYGIPGVAGIHNLPDTAWIRNHFGGYGGSGGFGKFDTIHVIRGGSVGGNLNISGNVSITGSGFNALGQVIIGGGDWYGQLQLRSDGGGTSGAGRIRFSNTHSAGLDYFIQQDNDPSASSLIISRGTPGGAVGVKITDKNIYDGDGNRFLKVGDATVGTTTNTLTINNSGTGDASGATFNGSAAKTISYNSIGAQPTLVSGTNLKTINSTSLLGSTNILLQTPLVAGTDYLTPTGSAASLTGFPTFNQNTTGSAAKWTTARNLAGNSVDGSANIAFANKFIVQGTTDAGLSGAQFLGALGTGLVKNTTSTGVLSIATAGTDYLTPTGSAAGLTGLTSGQVTTALGFTPGIVNSIAVTTANGVSATSSGGANPALTVTLGAITPTTIVTTIKPATVYQTAAGTAGTDSVAVKHAGGIVSAISPTYYLSTTGAASTYVPQTTTIAGFALSGNVTLASLTATDASLTFSGGYNGALARTVGLNVTNANTWGALQTFGNNISIGGVTSTGAQGTGNIVFNNTPTLITPVLGVATATSVNKVAITAPATSATLTIANGGTLQETGAFALNLTTTAASTPTFPTGAGTLPYIGATNTWSALQTFGTNISIGGVTAAGATGTGNVVFSASPALTGTPTAPTQSALNNSTALATTAYADAAVNATATYYTTGFLVGSTGTGTAGSVTNPFTIGSNFVSPSMLVSSSGVAGSTTVYYGDGHWGTPAGGGTGANPTATIGLTAVNGVATTFTRSDAAPALSQAIAPTWTGIHTFQTTNTASSGTSSANYGTLIAHIGSQTSTAGFTDVLVNSTGTFGSGTHNLLDLQVSGTSKFSISNTGQILSSAGFNGGNITSGSFNTTVNTSYNSIFLTNYAPADATHQSLYGPNTIWNFPVWNTTSTTQNYINWKQEARGSGGATPGTTWVLSSSLTTTTTASYTDRLSLDGLTGNLTLSGGLITGGHSTIEGITSTGATGTGKFVFDSSPALTGTPTVPTASPGTNTTQAASTAFVTAAVAAGGGATGASPTASLGLTAINGSATTFMRSDAAPALSQSIAPTWTGIHTWNVNNLLTATSDIIFVNNTTASTNVNTVQVSPSINIGGTYWTGSASNAMNYRITAGNLFGNQFTISGQTNGGTWKDLLYIDPFGAFISKSQFTIQLSNTGTTPTEGLILQSTTASSAGSPVQWSGRTRFISRVWNTTATAADNQLDFTNEVRPVSGTTPTGKMFWASRLSVSGSGSFVDNMSLDNSGNLAGLTSVSTKRLIGSSSAPTIAAGTGAGTSPTVSIGAGSTDMAGTITVTTGTSPAGTSATVATITFNTTYGAAPNVILTPGESNTSALSGATQVRVPARGQSGAPTTTTFQITSGSTALTASTTYVWTYHVIQ